MAVTHAFASPGTYTVNLGVFDGVAGAGATIDVEVLAPNSAPTAADDRYTATSGQELVVGAPGVLRNDTDPDADVLDALVATGPASGTLSLAPDGSFTYTPAAGFVGTDSFTYIARDGAGESSHATAHITVVDHLVASIQQPINAHGDSVFKAGRGTVPVKWRLTRNGSATCTLPAATIHLARVSGSVDSAVNETVYGDGPDSGTSYRIAECQYHYNLSAKGLTAGEYRVSILVGGVVVGEAHFHLR